MRGAFQELGRKVESLGQGKGEERSQSCGLQKCDISKWGPMIPWMGKFREVEMILKIMREPRGWLSDSKHLPCQTLSLIPSIDHMH